MKQTRSRSVAFTAVLVGGLLCLVAGSQPWWRAEGDGTSVSFSGTDATAGLTQALGVVALAGGVLALALRSVGRRVLGGVLALAGVGITVIGALRLRPGAGAVQDKVRQVSLMDDYRLDPTFWNYGYAAAGLLILLAAALMLLRAGRWPSRADRFQRQAETAVAHLDPSAQMLAPDADPSLWWKAQDAGVDPTGAPELNTDSGADPRHGDTRRPGEAMSRAGESTPDSSPNRDKGPDSP